MEEKSIPYIAHEAALAREERTIKKLWILCIIMFFALVATNAGWIYYESQFKSEVTTIEAEQTGADVNIVGGGNVEYGAESQNHN